MLEGAPRIDGTTPVSKEKAPLIRSTCHDSECYVVLARHFLENFCGARFGGTSQCQAHGAMDPLFTCTCVDAFAKGAQAANIMQSGERNVEIRLTVERQAREQRWKE